MPGETDLPSKLGRYELITRIGQGGMADVQLALQRGPMGFEKLVVVKLVHEKLATEKAFVDMLLDEARVAALLKHPNVVDIYDLGEVEGRYFIAMEYLEGEPLLAVLRAGRDGQRLDVNSTARLIADTAEGLDAAHELRSMAGKPLELVHHDVSLGNIVVLYNGQVKLVDFGVAKATQSKSTRLKVQGKFSYMAPEKLLGAEGDKRSDIFSLGCVLWEALTLRRLFKGSSDDETMQQVLESEIPLPSAVNGEVSRDYDAIVMRALERDPSLRYPTAKELAEDLEEVLRKVGYARKNDSIARYMQVTFKPHIEARKKLLQEVSSKGSASAAVLEAAFIGEPAAATSAGEFAIKFRGMPLEPPTGTPSHLQVDDRPTPTGSAPLDAFASAATGTPLPGNGVLARSNDRRNLYLAGGIVAALLVVIVFASMRGGSGTKVLAAQLPATKPVSVAQVSIDASTPDVLGAGEIVMEPVGATASATKPIDKPIEKPVVDKPADKPADKPIDKPADKPIDKPSAEALYRSGLQAHIKGDNKAALGFLRRAQQVNPNFAPTWRVLGLVYERLGEIPQARIAFVQYLRLAPKAADAATTQAKLAGLGKSP